MMVWYVPDTNMKYGQDSTEPDKEECTDPDCSCNDPFYKPWYAGKFANINEVANYWKTNYTDLLSQKRIIQ